VGFQQRRLGGPGELRRQGPVGSADEFVRVVVALVAEQPGLSRSALRAKLPGATERAWAAVTLAVRLGQAHEQLVGFRDRQGRQRRRRVLFPGPSPNGSNGAGVRVGQPEPSPTAAAAPAAAQPTGAPTRGPAGMMTSAELRAGRERAGWSQAELARRVRMPPSLVSRWEGGGRQAIPASRVAVLRELLAAAEPAVRPDPAAAARAQALAAVGANPGCTRQDLKAKLGRGRAVREAVAWALAEGHLHQREIAYQYMPGRTRSERGLFPGPAPADSSPAGLTGTQLRTARRRLGWSLSDLAQPLGVSPTLLSYWERGRHAIPERHAKRVRELLDRAQPAPDPVEELRAAIVQIVTDAPGLTRTRLAEQLGRLLGPGTRGAAALERAVADQQVHERVVLRPDRAGPLVAGGPLPRMTPAELRAARRRAGWSQAELGRRIGAAQTQVANWETGRFPIAPGRVGRLREVLAAAEPAAEISLAHVLAAVDAEPGLSWTELGHRLGEAKAVTVAARQALSDGRLHERWVTYQDRRGLHRTRRGLFLGPAPAGPDAATVEAGELRAARHRARLTQDELGERLGVGGTLVCIWERGRRSIPLGRAAEVRQVLAAIEQEPPRPPRHRRRRTDARLPTLAGGDLRAARRRVGWSQADLAARLGVTAQALSIWERGRWPIPAGRAAELRRLLEAAPPTSPPPDPTAKLADRVVEVVTREPGLSATAITARLPGDVRRRWAAIRRAEQDRRVHTQAVRYRDASGRMQRKAAYYLGPPEPGG